ncbi:lactonase family protein [Stomatobaculum longum]|uniref:lactonase family protein n=1 Tax=Stomatobaculum longum TaxID=796942 RepID=UPI0028DC6C67|nr:beta-propeller fold lactonase family protein [Stomatobaculum longum]
MSYAYVGCRTTKERNARGEGLKTYQILSSGEWKELQCLYTEPNPSFQTLDREGKFLYSVHGDITKVSSYRVVPNHTLEHLNTIDIGGRNPVDVTVDKENKNVIVATLQGGTLYTIARNEDGSLGSVIAKFTYEGKEDGKVSTIHQCLWDKKRNFLFAAAQGRVNGYGQFRSLKYDHATGVFTEASKFMARTWDEPRHAAVHPNNRWVYMCEEKGNKVLYFQFNDVSGELDAMQELTTVPETITGYSDASEVMVDPSGQWVLVSNRYTDSMAVYRIDPITGYLKNTGFYPCLGKTPRFFCFGPNGKCYVANEDSDTIIEFDFDSITGQLTPTLNIVQTGSPVCIVFAE